MPESAGSPGPEAASNSLGSSTADLLLRARAGEAAAETLLFERYHPILLRIAHGRLPFALRDMKDTDDLVQETLTRAFRRLDDFEYRREGAFLAYLRQILLNQIRQEIRRRKVRPTFEPLAENHPDRGRGPLETVSWFETLERYDRALQELDEDQREAIIMRIELGLGYEEIARSLERPSANAVRMMVARALARMAGLMGTALASEDTTG
jgi:RNA polymerase sigma factor (sigma-70 family)